MHEPLGAHDPPAEDVRRGTGARGRRRGSAACPAKARRMALVGSVSVGLFGPGERRIASGASAAISAERHLVVAPHQRLGAQLAQVLHEVPGEGVVVVDDEDHAWPPPGAAPAPRRPRGRGHRARSDRARPSPARRRARARSPCAASPRTPPPDPSRPRSPPPRPGRRARRGRGACGWRCRCPCCRGSRGSRPPRHRRRAAPAPARR